MHESSVIELVIPYKDEPLLRRLIKVLGISQVQFSEREESSENLVFNLTLGSCLSITFRKFILCECLLAGFNNLFLCHPVCQITARSCR